MLGESAPKLTAVEIDSELAAMLTERFAGKPTVEIVRGDATALEFPDGRFSGAASFTMLHHVPTADLQDQLFALRRMPRPTAQSNTSIIPISPG